MVFFHVYINIWTKILGENMKKKIISIIILLILIIILASKSAFAADFFTSSETDLVDLTLSSGDTVIIKSNSDVKLYSSNPSMVYYINIVCEDNVSLEIENINIQPSSGCALIFEGGVNSLTISGTNTLKIHCQQSGNKGRWGY